MGGAVGICGGEAGGNKLSSSSSVSNRALLMGCGRKGEAFIGTL